MGFVQSLLSVFQDKRELLDLSSFNDEVAWNVAWTPLVGGGTNFCTHRATRTKSLTSSSLSFKTTLGAYLFSAVFLAVGLISAIASLSTGGVDPGAFLMSLLFPLLFVAIGAFLIWRMRSKECCFDQFSSQFIQGTTVHNLKEVHAIQLIREYVRGNKSSYYSYELNLVCRDGSRLNVTDHGSLAAIREDAQLLGNYLNRPVWDVIDFRIPDGLSGGDGKFETLRTNLFE